MADQAIDGEIEMTVSLALSQVMYCIMASRGKTRAERNSSLTVEYMMSVKTMGAMKYHVGGSGAEGTGLKDSDLDYMMVDSNMSVCQDEAKAGDIAGHVFKVDTSGCQPGYTKLRLIKLDPNVETLLSVRDKNIEDALVQSDEVNRVLSSEKIVQCWVSSQQDLKEAIYMYPHGPCATSVYDPVPAIRGRNVEIHEKDTAFAITFEGWPAEAEEWFSRKRDHTWPPPDLREKIRGLQCHVVPVGGKTSATSSIEWRISYLLVERELIWSFNDVQIQCHVIMKRLMKLYFNPITPDDLSSYHMKNIMFWMSEDNPTDIWMDENLLDCVRMCLNRFRESIRETSLPHYIDRSKNLFYGKLGDEDLKQKVWEKVDEVLVDLVGSVLSCVVHMGFDLPLLWSESECDANKFLSLCREKLESEWRMKAGDYKAVMDVFYQGQVVSTIMADLAEADHNQLITYYQAFTTNPNKDVDFSFTDVIKRYISIRLAINESRELLKHIGQPGLEKKLEDITQQLEEGSVMDGLSGKLYLATFLYRLGRLKETRYILNQIQATDLSKLVYAGVHSVAKTVIKKQDEAELAKSSHGEIALDVQFSEQDEFFVPHAVKLECRMMDYGVDIHPVVFLHYLSFLTALGTSPEGLTLLEKVLSPGGEEWLEEALEDQVLMQQSDEYLMQLARESLDKILEEEKEKKKARRLLVHEDDADTEEEDDAEGLEACSLEVLKSLITEDEQTEGLKLTHEGENKDTDTEEDHLNPGGSKEDEIMQQLLAAMDCGLETFNSYATEDKDNQKAVGLKTTHEESNQDGAMQEEHEKSAEDNDDEIMQKLIAAMACDLEASNSKPMQEDNKVAGGLKKSYKEAYPEKATEEEDEVNTGDNNVDAIMEQLGATMDQEGGILEALEPAVREEARAALQHMEDAVQDCRQSLTYHNHLNLLGHCHFLAGNYRKAETCFQISIKDTEARNVENAARIHLDILILHSLQTSSQAPMTAAALPDSPSASS